MRKILILAPLAVLLTVGCKEKKTTGDIIAPKVEKPATPSAPEYMQSYSDSREVLWLDRNYKVEVKREACDSLPLVSDERGKKFVDNSITLTVRRSDGSVAISKRFTKSTFEKYLNKKFWKEGILEGLVFDEVDDQQLEFAASVCLPQTDEYIPLVVKIDRNGNVSIKRDSELDTHGEQSEAVDDDDDDGV